MSDFNLPILSKDLYSVRPDGEIICNGCGRTATEGHSPGCGIGVHRKSGPDTSFVEDGVRVTAEPVNPKDKIGSTKAPIGVVPMSMVVYAAMQMHNGAGKYGRHNYRSTGVGAQIYFEGLMRHAIAWWNGEELDEEGVPNLAGMAANLAIICDGIAHGYMHDDRPPAVDMRKLYDQAAAQVKVNNERNAGKNPRHFTIKDKAFKVPS